ncbi:MAG TPA: dTMP kinase [Dehalococcoidia bacterium]|nr:dTMP kinase [Dehalococcoidia bacterium]
MALFITFEGGEGSGKSVQARALYRRLSQSTIPALLTHEPGGTPCGNRIGRWLKWAEVKDISPLTELLLFNASRAQLVGGVIRPNLKNGMVVVCDRYADSTIAYQSYGRGLDLELVETINDTATQGLKPDLIVLLDIPVEEGLARKRVKKQDRFEQEDIAFHQRVRKGYLKLAANDPQRWLVVDASQSKAKIREIIWQRVSQLLSRQGD